MRTSLVGVTCAISLACGSPTAPIAGRLAVKVAPPNLELTNVSPATVYYLAMESGLAMRSNWAPCTDPEKCSGIPVFASHTLAYADIDGYSDTATHASVYWWHLVRRGSGYGADSIRGTVVELRRTGP